MGGVETQISNNGGKKAEFKHAGGFGVEKGMEKNPKKSLGRGIRNAYARSGKISSGGGNTIEER